MKNEVGTRIATLRKQHGWSQIELAEKLNVSDKAVSKWENGGMPSVELFPVLSKLFNVSIDYLMMGDGESDGGEEKDEDKENSEFLQSIENLTIENLELILSDQRELYTESELLLIEERCAAIRAEEKAERLRQKAKKKKKAKEAEKEAETAEEALAVANLPKNMNCPKCDGLIENPKRYCPFCDCDLLNPKKQREKPTPQYEELIEAELAAIAKEGKKESSLGCFFYFIAFLFPVIGMIWAAYKRDGTGFIFSIIMLILDIVVGVILGVVSGVASARAML